MTKRYRAHAILLFLFSIVPLAQAFRQSPQTSPYDATKWTLLKRIEARLSKSESIDVLLLRSVEVTGRGGIEQPLKDVQLLITKNGRVLYNFSEHQPDSQTRFFIDDALDVKDVTRDGTPEVIFHSGSEGASDSFRDEHILQYSPAKTLFVNIELAEFFQSGSHGLKWLTMNNKSLLVISKRGEWPDSVPPELQCHYCPGYFVFEAYEWRHPASSFVLIKSFAGKRLHRGGEEALKGEWAFIQSQLH